MAIVTLSECGGGSSGGGGGGASFSLGGGPLHYDGLPMLAMNGGKQHVGGIPSPLPAAGGGGLPGGRYSPTTYRPDGMRRMGNVPVRNGCGWFYRESQHNTPSSIYYLCCFIFYEVSFYPAYFCTAVAK